MKIGVRMNSSASHRSAWPQTLNVKLLLAVAVVSLMVPAQAVWPCPPPCCEVTPGCNCEEVCPGFDCAGQSTFCQPVVCDHDEGENGDCVAGTKPSVSITVHNTVYLCWWTKVTFALVLNDATMPTGVGASIKVDFRAGNAGISIDGVDHEWFTQYSMSTTRWVKGCASGPSSIHAIIHCPTGGIIEVVEPITVEKQQVTLNLVNGDLPDQLFQNQELQLDVSMTTPVPPADGDTLESRSGKYVVGVWYEREENQGTYWPGGAFFRRPEDECGEAQGPCSCTKKSKCEYGWISEGVTFLPGGPSQQTFYVTGGELTDPDHPGAIRAQGGCTAEVADEIGNVEVKDPIQLELSEQAGWIDLQNGYLAPHVWVFLNHDYDEQNKDENGVPVPDNTRNYATTSRPCDYGSYSTCQTVVEGDDEVDMAATFSFAQDAAVEGEYAVTWGSGCPWWCPSTWVWENWSQIEYVDNEDLDPCPSEWNTNPEPDGLWHELVEPTWAFQIEGIATWVWFYPKIGNEQLVVYYRSSPCCYSGYGADREEVRATVVDVNLMVDSDNDGYVGGGGSSTTWGGMQWCASQPSYDDDQDDGVNDEEIEENGEGFQDETRRSRAFVCVNVGFEEGNRVTASGPGSASDSM